MKQTPTLKAFLVLSLLPVLLFLAACNKSSDDVVIAPTIQSYPVITGVTTTSAQTYAAVTSYGSGIVTANGVCWSATNTTPTIADSKTSNTIDTLQFAASLTGLTPNTMYYLRAYATNGGGTGYGDVVKFKTNSASFATTATVSTFSGNNIGGFVNGTATISQFNNPQGICADASGNIYVADSYNNVIRKISALGVSSTFAGTGTLGYTDGAAATAQFYASRGVAADAQGNIYVADYGNNIIRKITAAGVVSTLAGRGDAGYGDGTGTAAVFKSPSGLAVDAAGNVYVADRGNNCIRKITPAGVVSTLAGNVVAGQTDATGTLASFNAPASVTVDASGNVYVADPGNYAIRKITPAGVVTTMVGNSLFKTAVASPTGICIDTQGNLYITDASGRILEISSANILYSLAGNINTSGFANGTNTSVIFNTPQAITIDAAGNFYIADYYNNLIRKMTIATQQ